MKSHLVNIRDQDRHDAWMEATLWLSLDRFERFYREVGLSFSSAEAVRSSARGVISAKSVLDSTEDDLDYIDRLSMLVDDFVRRIDETNGMLVTACVTTWIEGSVLVAVSEPLWHRTWRILLYRMPSHDPALIASSYSIPRNTIDELFEIAACYRCDDDDIDARVEATDQEPFSEWDGIAYAEYRHECPDLSPLDGLRTHLKCIRFDKYWHQILRMTRPEDIDALIRWGRALLVLHTTIRGDAAQIPNQARRLS